MKKLIIAVLAVLAIQTQAFSTPLVDTIMGAVLIANGGVFAIASSDQKDDRITADNMATEHTIDGIIADENASAAGGAAAWELTINGNTAAYQSFIFLHDQYLIEATNELNQAFDFNDKSENAREKENLYKGVSVTSFVIGGFYLVKGIYGFRTQPRVNKFTDTKSNFSWTKDFSFSPLPRLDGARMAWSKKF